MVLTLAGFASVVGLAFLRRVASCETVETAIGGFDKLLSVLDREAGELRTLENRVGLGTLDAGTRIGVVIRDMMRGKFTDRI
jgi:hypothetical protein